MSIAFALVLGVAATASAQPTPVTFTKDVAPIFQKSCQNCHRPAVEAKPGTYVLRACADDGILVAAKDVTVTVSAAR